MKINRLHKPVMTQEVIEGLEIEKFAHLNKQPRFIDATVGAGGHSKEIIMRGGFVLGIDINKKILDVAYLELEKACLALNRSVEGSFKLIQGNFRDIKSIAEAEGFNKVDGVLFDLGISSLHYDMNLGFSFRETDSELDMRNDKTFLAVKASDLLNALPKRRLIKLFALTLPYSEAKDLSEKVLKARESKKFATVGDFTALFKRARETKLHPATKAFLALRMAVNNEIENLQEGLEGGWQILGEDRRLVVISFHSGEDTVVKRFMKEKEKDGSRIPYGAKRPKESEIVYNKRARSAVLRILEK